MADNTKLPEIHQQKKVTAETLWLQYFNQTLYKKGVITEVERNRIANMIASRCMSKNK